MPNITCTLTNSAYYEEGQYVRYPANGGTSYYTANDTFSVTAGTEVYFYCNAGPVNTIYLDGDAVASAVSYTWMPDADFSVTFESSIGSYGKLYIVRTGQPITIPKTTITYGGNTIAELTVNKKFTSSGLAGKVASANIVITADGTSGENTTVAYNGNTLFNQLSGSYTIPANKIISHEFAVAHGTPAVVYPVKGDIITLDTISGKTWRVLRINSSVAEVLMQEDYSNNTLGATTNNYYEGSGLDTKLNTTYYDTLSATVKAAIVDKTFRQDKWYVSTTGDPDYVGTYNTSTAYNISLSSATYGNEITRHIYAISVQDIVDYVGVTPSMTSSNTTLNRTNMRALFGGITSGAVWTRTAYAGNTSQGLIANMTGRIQSGANGSSYKARPAFQIDLSKISWSKQ